MELETTVIDANAAASSSDADSMLSSPDFQGTNPGADGAAAGEVEGEALAAADKTADQGAADVKDGKEGGEDDRFDKHPRFQELNATVKAEREARTKAEAELSLLKRSPLSPEFIPPATDKAEFKDINTMTAEEIREWQEDDPLGFAQNLKQQAAWEAKQSIRNDSLRDETVTRIEKTFSTYAAENPTFNAMWESGEIERFMDANPGHNAISAHMILAKGDGAAATQAAVAKAVKEAEERVTKNFLAKRNATVLAPGAAPRATADGIDPALTETSKYGGTKAVLASRLAAMRSGQAAG